MTRARVALASGLSLMILALGVTLTRSPPSVARSDRTPLEGTIAYMNSGSRACQAHEPLPNDVTAVRFSLYAGIGPRVDVDVLSNGRSIAHGVRGAGWRGESPTVHLATASSGAFDAKLCFALGSSGERVGLDGSPAKPGEGVISQSGHSLGVKLRVEYLRSGDRSWFSLASVVARRVGLGRWAAGTWVAVLVLMLVVALVIGTAWLTARELL